MKMQDDVKALRHAQIDYGDSWKRRGGVGAFMMAARKWDRLEQSVGRYEGDILKAWREDTRPEGIRDDIRDLRRYLLLIEAESRMLESNVITRYEGDYLSKLPEIAKELEDGGYYSRKEFQYHAQGAILPGDNRKLYYAIMGIFWARLEKSLDGWDIFISRAARRNCAGHIIRILYQVERDGDDV